MAFDLNIDYGKKLREQDALFLLAETFKYFLLIFAPYDEHVFNIEAHPWRQIHTIDGLSDKRCERMSPVIH